MVSESLGLYLWSTGGTQEPNIKTFLAGEEGFEPSHAGIKIQCLNQLGDSPTRATGYTPATDLS